MPGQLTSKPKSRPKSKRKLEREIDSLYFLRAHYMNYSMWGKSARAGELIWSVTHEPCDGGEGDKRHFAKMRALIEELDEQIAETKKKLEEA